MGKSSSFRSNRSCDNVRASTIWSKYLRTGRQIGRRAGDIEVLVVSSCIVSDDFI